MPVLLIDSPLNLAMPPLTVTLDVPLSVPPPAFVPITRVILSLLSLLTRLLPASRTSTLTAGLILAPAVTFVGWPRKTRWVPGGVMLNAAEVDPDRVPEVATSV